MNESEHREFAWFEGLAMCLAAVGVQLSSEFIAGWGNFFYTPPDDTGRIVYVTALMAVLIFATGRVFDAITDPLVGMWSDRTRSRPGRWRIPPISGRRRPFIFWGSILMTITAVAFWHPPVPGTSWANCVYGTLIVCLHWGLFTVCAIPLKSLEPEIARSQRARVGLGIWVASGMITGLAISQILPGIIIDVFDPVETEGGMHSPAAIQRAALLLALISTALLQLPVWLVRERYTSGSSKPPLWNPLVQIREAMRNRPFFCYFMTFFCLNLGLLAVQRVLAHWAVLALNGDEGYVSLLMAPFMLTALLTLAAVPTLTRRIPLKWLMVVCVFIYATGLPMMYVIGRLPLPENLSAEPFLEHWMALLGTHDVVSAMKALLGAGLFAYCGVGQGLFYALLTPVMGEIVDYDELYSGKRREALYNGMWGIAIKGSQTLSIAVANFSMAFWGKSVASPWGVHYVGLIAGIFSLIGLVFALFYPVLQVTREDNTP